MKRMTLGLGFLAIIGCTTASSHEVTPVVVPRAHATYRFDSLTATQLADLPGRTIVDAIRQTHQGWITSTEGGRVQFWVGLVETDAWRVGSTPAAEFAAVKYLHSTDAHGRYGERSTGPAIILYPGPAKP